MLPVIQLGPLSIQTHLLLLLVAAWAGLAVAAYVARQGGIDGDHIYNAGLYALVASLLAARLGHVVLYWQAYRAQPLDIIGLNTRAFAPWPGVLAAALTAGWYIHWRHLAWHNVIDAFAAGMLMALAVLDLDNLLTGQAIGAPSSLPWAVSAYGGATRHPSQIYELLATLVTLAAVLWVCRRNDRPGTGAWVALLGYGLSRLLLEPFRADSAVLPGGLRTAQVLGLAAALLALWALRPRIDQAGIPSGVDAAASSKQ
jgi:phosphatidylglycerol:prolipoprotein diacylglycerol transferase